MFIPLVDDTPIDKYNNHKLFLIHTICKKILFNLIIISVENIGIFHNTTIRIQQS